MHTKKARVATWSRALAAAGLVLGTLTGCPVEDGEQQPCVVPMGGGLPPLVDTDCDGVLDQHDACPSQGTHGKVNVVGCPDEDGDGVTDDKDQCEATLWRTPVDENGCPVAVGPGGGEVRIDRYASGPERRRMISILLGLRPLEKKCEEDMLPPPPPRVVMPEPWSVMFADWHEGPKTKVTVAWNAVGSDKEPCQPVRYGLVVHRRPYSGQKWEPYIHERSLSKTTYELVWPKVEWGRYRVYAVDNNGQASPRTAWRFFTFAVADPPLEDSFIRPPEY